ncbi:MAG: hypothetical protein JRE82_15250 [Deltaproteobacteria bacterium]|nr:hypothetical protein [Deltaproteobacteria bacterium]
MTNTVHSLRLGIAWFALLGVLGCSSGTPDPNANDGGQPDAGPTDGGQPDGGTSPVSAMEPTLLLANDIFAIWGTTRNDLFIAGSDASLAHYDGTSWRPHDAPAAVRNTRRNDLHGLFGFGSDDVYAAGESGTILHFDGASWSAIDDPAVGSARLVDLWGSNANNLYAVGERGAVLRFNGIEWMSVDIGFAFSGDWRGISGSSSTDVLIAGTTVRPGQLAEPRFARFDGTTWSDVTVPDKAANGGPRLNDVWSISRTLAFAVGSPGWILEWNGSTLSEVPSGTTEAVNSVWGVNANETFAFAVRNAFLRYNGSAWTDATGVPISDNSDPVGEIFGFASNYLVAARSGVFGFDGSAWTELLPAAQNVGGLWASDPDNVLVLGSRTFRQSGGVLQEEDFGGLSTPVFAAAWGPADNIIAVGSGGSILLYNGTNWGVMTSTNTAPLNDVWGAANDEVFAVGSDGTIVHFDGSSWGTMASGTTAFLNAVWGRSPDDVYAVGAEGTILHYDGLAWSAEPTGLDAAFLTDIVEVDDGELWVAYAEGVLVGSGGTWTPMPIMINGVAWGVSAIDAFDSENIYLSVSDPAGVEGPVFVHFDGETFTPLSGVGRRSSILALGARDVISASRQSVVRHRVP